LSVGNGIAAGEDCKFSIPVGFLFKKLTCSLQYETQKQSEFFVTLTDNLKLAEFLTLTELVADYLTSIPELTQNASKFQSGDESFIEIRAGQMHRDGDHPVYRHQVRFMLDVEAEGRPCCFWREVQTRGDDQVTVEERRSVMRRTWKHERGLYKERSRVC
jgi:hypothetical protein